jgi:hypothetical protein
MKVIDLGHGGFAIEPESAADSVQTLTPAQLQRSEVSDEAIKIYRRYIERTSFGTKEGLQDKFLSSFKLG